MLQHDKKSAKPREMIFSTEVQEIKWKLQNKMNNK
jgi:hypothetical protein